MTLFSGDDYPEAPSAFGWSVDAELDEIRGLIAEFDPETGWPLEAQRDLMNGLAWLDKHLTDGRPLPRAWEQRADGSPRTGKAIRATDSLRPL